MNLKQRVRLRAKLFYLRASILKDRVRMKWLDLQIRYLEWKQARQERKQAVLESHEFQHNDE